MKKFLTVLVLCLVCTFCAEGLLACDGNNGTQQTQPENNQTVDNSKAVLVSAEGFTMEDNCGKITVPNDVEIFSFLNAITVSNGASWVISTDIQGLQTVATKTIPLTFGDNVVYLLVSSGDGKNINLYIMTIRRRPIYTVSFNTNGGTKVEEQQIEEGGIATEPKTTKVGYRFECWDYDFTKPITDNITVSAIFYIDTLELEKYEYTKTNDLYSLTGVKNKLVEEIILPDYFVAIENGAFSDCLNLTTITLPDSVIYINDYAFSDCRIEVATIPAIACYHIGYNNSKLKTVNITCGTSIAYRAFYGCTSLESIVIPETITSIGGSAFRNCSALTNITLPSNITRIEDATFYNCNNLTAINISDNITSIGKYAFQGCTALTSIVIPERVSSIGSQAFYETSLNSAIFINPVGWQYILKRFNGDETIYFSKGDIANSATAASYLKTYYSNDWKIG